MSGFDNEVVVSLGERLQPSTAQAVMLMQGDPTDVSRINHVGNPNGAVAANPSSLSHDPVSGNVYIKTTGTGNTGWDLITQGTPTPVGSLAYFANANGDAYLGGNWLRCQGQILSQATYPVLFSRIGFVNGPFTVFNTTTTFTAQQLQDLLYDGTRYVASGNNGTIGTSTNGVAWSPVVTGQTATFSTLTYDGTKYYASGGSNVYSSTNLTAWTTTFTAVVNSTNNLIARGNGILLDITASKMMLTSTDASSWTTRSPQGSRGVYALSTHVNGGLQGCMMSTTNTANGWSIRNALLTGDVSSLNFLNGIFVGTSSTQIVTSTDGTTWTNRATGGLTAIRNAGFGGSLYVFGNGTGSVRSTTDFVTYNTSVFGAGQATAAIAFGAGIYVAAASQNIMTSTDAIASPWTTTSTIPGIASLQCLKFVNGGFIGGGNAGTIITSTNGLTWTTTNSIFGTNIVYSVDFLNSLYVVGLGNGSVASSTDAVTWGAAQPTGTTASVLSVTYDGSNYYAYTDLSVYRSANLTAWTLVSNITSNASENFQSLNFANGLFLIGGNQGGIFTTTDGITVTTNSIGTSFAVLDMTYGAGIYLAVGATGRVFSSNNLSTWTARNSTTTTQTISAAYFGNNLYVIGGQAGFIKTSTDAIQWDTVTNNLTTQSTTAIASTANEFALVGNSGFVGYSQNTYPYNQATQFQLPTDAQIGITLEFPSNFRRALYIKAQ